MRPATIEHYNHLQQRFLTISTPEEMPDNLLFSFLLHQYMVEIKSDVLTPQDRLTILNRYLEWYKKNDKKPPFPEWIDTYRKKWQSA